MTRMPKTPPALLLSIAVCLVLSLTSIPAVSQSAPSYLTTSMVPSGAAQRTISNYHGVIVNYTDTLASNLTALIYMDVSNSAGQVISLSLATCDLTHGQKVSCFVALSPSLPPGNYTASVFAATTSHVAISVPSTLPVKV